MKTALLALFFTFFIAVPAQADAVDDKIAGLQARWEKIKYATNPKDAQIKAAAALTQDAATLAEEHPDRPEPKILEAISLATEASFNRGLGSLPKVKRAKALLEQSLAQDATAMNGAAYTYLGSLYAQVPGWPVGFGDDKKAEAAFKKALAIAPDNIDTNYFLGEYLLRRKQPAAATEALQKALNAAPRPGRELADKGRRDEIRLLIAEAGMRTNQPRRDAVNN